MKYIKKFNLLNESDDSLPIKEGKKYIFSDIFGEFDELVSGKRYIIKTTNGIYFHGMDKGEYERRLSDSISLSYYEKSDNLLIYSVIDDNGLFGFLLMKDNVPYIFSIIPGDDDRGSTVFNNTFVVLGYDGTYLYDINNPLNIKMFV